MYNLLVYHIQTYINTLTSCLCTGYTLYVVGYTRPTEILTSKLPEISLISIKTLCSVSMQIIAMFTIQMLSWILVQKQSWLLFIQ